MGRGRAQNVCVCILVSFLIANNRLTRGGLKGEGLFGSGFERSQSVMAGTAWWLVAPWWECVVAAYYMALSKK